MSLRRPFLLGLALLGACAAPLLAQAAPPPSYFDHSAEPAPLTGGARMIPIETPKGQFNVWVKKVGNNPHLKLLLLHGGPAAPHDYFEAMDSFLPQAGIEYIYYDQLGAGNSDRPDDDDLWTIDRYVDEVEQVRKALTADGSNLCLLGQSWGGLLAIEYALKYPGNVKCMVISNMMASIPAYNAYAHDVLMPQMNQDRLAEILALEKAGKTEDPRYMELLAANYYEQHILRRPIAQWPEPVVRAFSHINQHVYTLMQGPSEMGSSGRLEHWDRFADLARIQAPTLVIGAKYDTMDPAYMEKMARQLPHGQYAYMPEGGHLAMYDDQQRYFAALVAFLKSQEKPR